TLGFMNSQWGTTEAEVTNIINRYRAEKIPIDGFILDFDWKAWGEDNYGAWGKFAQEMRDKGIKLVGILKPRILLRNAQGNLTEAAKYAQEHHFFFDWEQPYPEYFS